MFKAASVQNFQKHFRGELLQEGDAGYDEGRRVWNGMIDKRPALIARCTGTNDCRRLHKVRSRVRGTDFGARRRP